MTTTTVEVERTVTDEEEVTICDDCQREVDDRGVEEMPCDFCSRCKRAYTDDPPDDVITAEEWLTKHIADDPYTPKRNFSNITLWAGVALSLSVLALIGTAIAYGSAAVGIAAIITTCAAINAWLYIRDFRQQYVELSNGG